MTPLGLLALGSGLVLMFSAYRNVSPLALVTNALQGKSGAAAPPLNPHAGASSAGASSGSSSTSTPSAPTPNNPSGYPYNDTAGMEAWIKAHPGHWPHPGAGDGDFWNHWAKLAADAAHVPMIGASSTPPSSSSPTTGTGGKGSAGAGGGGGGGGSW